MAGQDRNGEPPPDPEGPPFRAADHQVDDVDLGEAQTRAERHTSWARAIPSAVAAFAEDILRQWVIAAALLLSVAVGLMGATADDRAWVIAGLASGVLGAVLVVAAALLGSLARQWAVAIGVIVAQAALMVAYNQAGS